jgi:hypothetical protein
MACRLYSDRHGIFWRGRTLPTLAEQFAGKHSTTQLGQALEAAAIAWVAARSPQAKGRVERLWGTAQDRLRVELRLAGATTREEANALPPTWIERHNARYAVAAADPASAWRAVPGGLEPAELFASATAAGWPGTGPSRSTGRASCSSPDGSSRVVWASGS